MIRLLLIVMVLFAGCQSTGKRTTYLIKIEKGDTLAAIARKYDTSWQSIVKINDLKSARHIRVGQVLRVQPGPGGLVAGAGKARIEQPATDDKKFEKSEGKPRKGLLFDRTSAKVVWPLNGKITSHFGKRWGRQHHGIDIKGYRGKRFTAAAAGRVTFVGRQRGYGKTIIVQHNGFETLYAHCTKILVNRGDWISQGDVIGTVGSTGRATGPHLHFEIRKGGKAFNPLAWLKSPPAT